jgi:tetratricopeptide (TPR) repeat protein
MKQRIPTISCKQLFYKHCKKFLIEQIVKHFEIKYVVLFLLLSTFVQLCGCILTLNQTSTKNVVETKKSTGIPNPSSLIFGDVKQEKRATELWKALNKAEKDASNYLDYGIILLKENHVDEAIEVLELGLNLNHKESKFYLLLASIYQSRSKEEDKSKATTLLEKAVLMFPANGEVHLNLGNLYIDIEENAKAILEFQKALDLTSDPMIQLSAHLGLGACYNKSGDVARATMHHRAAKAIYPAINEILIQAEISKQTPPPTFRGQHRTRSAHPLLDNRIKRVLEEISQTSGEKQLK